ncbi:hypothetical protein [Bartonella schoenbuchensis]|uniref:DNA-damage-inducible protein J n=1 Tax=Bartonella schoenbuchensis (strain DSM 13525 / NCTC 13165 / R1) TaxID=687861 RepID=E6YZS7_BARSR|nr:hypothetical protein [Bartonella schoenbuchensis]AQX30832.1 DNA-damage-inducible protein J [Bartonella schoenbuchensis R1]CBI82365.1 hypothetical protein B11C_40220 [Bartonella schoenbuchensis R1]
MRSHIPDGILDIAKNRALPFDSFQPNLETLQAIEDVEVGRVKRTSLNGLRAMIHNDQDNSK